MFPFWQTESGLPGILESNKQILSKHMRICNISAMILKENRAIELFTILKTANKPAFFGKNVISENLEVYNYY